LWQVAQYALLLQKTLAATAVELGEELAQKAPVLLDALEVEAAAQKKGLANRPLQTVVALLHVAVLVGAGGLRLATTQVVMPEQSLVALGEFFLVQGVVHGRRQPVRLMSLWHAAEFPQRRLQPLAEAFEALRVADAAGFPVGVGEHEVIDEVVEGLFGDGDAELAHVRVIGLGQLAGAVQLREERFLGGAFQGPPPLHATLQGAQLAV
jgi:hypothetical protein